MKTKTFSNGLVLLYEKNTVHQNDCFMVNVLTGSALETSKQLGINHLVEHLMFKASNKRTTRQISEELERQGAIINAWTNYDNVCFHFTCLPSKVEICAEIYADMIFNKAIPEQEFKQEKNVVCQEIKMYEDDFEATNETNYFEHFWNMKDVAGTVDSVQSFTLKQINNFIKERYIPANMVISVCSHLSYRKICNIVEKYFGNIKNTNDYIDLRSEWNNKKVYKRQNFGDIFKQKKKTAQVQVLNAYYIPGQNLLPQSPALYDYYNLLLSGGLSSILFREIREKHGVCYRIWSQTMTLYPSIFNRNGISIFVVKSSTEKSNLKLYLAELEKTMKSLPTLLSKNDIEKAINIFKTAGIKANQVALRNFYVYCNPSTVTLGKSLKDEFKYIENHAEELAYAAVDILSCLKCDVAILGDVK